MPKDFIPGISTLTFVLQNQQFWLYLLGYTLVTVPMAVLIGKITEAWSLELTAPPTSSNASLSRARVEKPGLQNAGKWIGIIERILI